MAAEVVKGPIHPGGGCSVLGRAHLIEHVSLRCGGKGVPRRCRAPDPRGPPPMRTMGAAVPAGWETRVWYDVRDREGIDRNRWGREDRATSE